LELETVLNTNDVRLPPRTIGVGAQRRPNEEYGEAVRKMHHQYAYPMLMRSLDAQMMFSQKVVREILDLFEKHLAPPLAGLLRPCFVTDMTDVDHPVTVFNREVFIASVRDDQRQFYAAFLLTTMFQEFSDRMMDGTMRESGLRGSPETAATLSAFVEDYIDFNLS
jgi:hypothetical protein